MIVTISFYTFLVAVFMFLLHVCYLSLSSGYCSAITSRASFSSQIFLENIIVALSLLFDN
jgi:hypothetical protein